MSQTCTRCGFTADDVALYCAICGSALPGEDPAFSTGVLGLRVAHEGDSAPMPPVTETSVGQLASGQAMLVVLRGPQEGSRFVLDPSEPVIVIGRTPECELFLDDVTGLTLGADEQNAALVGGQLANVLERTKRSEETV